MRNHETSTPIRVVETFAIFVQTESEDILGNGNWRTKVTITGQTVGVTDGRVKCTVINRLGGEGELGKAILTEYAWQMVPLMELCTEEQITWAETWDPDGPSDQAVLVGHCA